MEEERERGRERERERERGGGRAEEHHILTIPYEVQKMMMAIAKNSVNELVWMSGCLF